MRIFNGILHLGVLRAVSALTARKVRIQLLGTESLHVREVEVYDSNGVNRALNKPASQSSAYDGKTTASKGVDGLIVVDYPDITHTGYELGAWWQVDLEEDVLVQDVKVYNRFNFEGRLSNSVVLLLDGSDKPIASYEIGDASNTALFEISDGNFTEFACLEDRIGSEMLAAFLVGKTFTITDPDTNWDYNLTFSVGGGGSFLQDSGNIVSLGEFVGFQENADVAIFDNGDQSHGCPQPRSATVAFEEDCSASEIAFTEVDEPSICVYTFTISGFCICPE